MNPIRALLKLSCEEGAGWVERIDQSFKSGKSPPLIYRPLPWVVSSVQSLFHVFSIFQSKYLTISHRGGIYIEQLIRNQ